MTYPNAQNQAAGAIPVYEVASIGLNGAIPVYLVSQPTISALFPNDQGTSVAGVNQGAIPVRVVASPGTAHGSNQGVDANAIPVFVVAGGESKSKTYPNAITNAGGAIPVWRVN